MVLSQVTDNPLWELSYLFLELEWSWLNFVVTWLKIFKPNDSTKKLSQMVSSQVTGNRSRDCERQRCVRRNLLHSFF